ncbi:MAG: site-specific integrase [Actinomycetota bacterium]
MFELLAWTGLRWGEVAALRRRDLVLDGSNPVVRVRRALTRTGRFKPPKSRHGRRDVPLAPELVRTLRSHLAGLADDGPDSLAFPARGGQLLRQENVRRRVLRPAAEEADAAWIGFHTFRHGFASMLIERGASIVQVSRLLGHHSPAFTLRVYGHVLADDQAAPLDPTAELAGAQHPGVLEPEPVEGLPAAEPIEA